MDQKELFDAKEAAIEMIKKLEGFRSHAYLDLGGIKTIGYGSTRDEKGREIRMWQECTVDEASNYLRTHLERNVFPKLAKFADIPPKIYTSLCSLLYNVGSLGPSITDVIVNKRWNQIADCFRKYNKINGVESKGLNNRREKEIEYFKDEK